MFFIGGFNSIIPYVIYLSLIWTFMFVSFGGKIAVMLHKHKDNEIASAKMLSKSDESHLIHYSHYVSAEQSKNKIVARMPFLSGISLSPGPLQEIRIGYYSPHLPTAEPISHLFRGPPLFS